MWAISQIPLNDFKSLVCDCRDYALTRGGVLRQPDLKNDNCVSHIPFTVFPSLFPRKTYQKCLDVQPSINKLMLRVACDHNFMHTSLTDVVKVDEFTARLIEIDDTLTKEGLAQPITSCIIRSDFMLDKCSADDGPYNFRAKQVEVNTISSAMSTHSNQIKKLHDQIMSKYRIGIEESPVLTPAENDSAQVVAQGIIGTFDAYDKAEAYVLFVIEDRSINFSDHVMSELLIHELRPDIRVVRRRFIDLPYIMRLGPNKQLLIDGDKEIGLVYFRHGYDPSHYCFDSSWEIRLKIERSRAIKCPSINFHISGAKKFQQILNSREQLENYLDPKEAEDLSEMLCRFWQIDADTKEGQEGFSLGLSSNENLVLKPQREGGGHNIYGQEIAPFLKQISDPPERFQYILMEYINSPREKNWLLSSSDDVDKVFAQDWPHQLLVNELGIYGSILANGSNILANTHGGYLIRSKRSGVNEGGVASGYAGISSLVLYDEGNIPDVGEFFEHD